MCDVAWARTSCPGGEQRELMMRRSVVNGRLKIGVLGLGVMALVLVQACVTKTLASPADMSVGPALSVESFLRATNARDLDRMARLFGTSDGPIADTGGAFGCMFKRMGSWIAVSERCRSRQEVEIQMNAIALILEHQEYELGSGQRVPGRDYVTSLVPVGMVLADGRQVTGVPFMVVQDGSGQWLIEEIGLDRVTTARGP